MVDIAVTLVVPVLLSSILTIVIAAIGATVQSSEPSVSSQVRMGFSVFAVALLTPVVVQLGWSPLGSVLDAGVSSIGLTGMLHLLGVNVAALLLGGPAVLVGGVVFHRFRTGDWPDRNQFRAFAIGMGVASAVFGLVFLIVGQMLEMASVVVLLGIVVGGALLPQLRLRQYQTRPPTESERARIEPALEKTGFDQDRVTIVLGGPGNLLWRPWVLGFGRFGYLFVPEEVFETYEEDTLEAMLVRLTISGHGGRYRTLCWGGWLAVLVGILTFVRGLTDPLIVGGLLFALLVPLAFVAYGYRLVYRGDELAARITGTEAQLDMMRAQADQFGIEVRFARLVKGSAAVFTD